MLRHLAQLFWCTDPLPPNFPEEPLLLSAGDGFGFFPASPGLRVKDDQYQVLRKLGVGRHSSSWLVLDSQTGRYHAMKILTAHATLLHDDGILLELDIMKAIDSKVPSEHTRAFQLPKLYDHFEMEGPHGRHLCLVQPVLSTDIGAFRRTAPSKSLQVPKVKIIIAQVMDALSALHAANIIHTDIKPNNILFRDGTATETIQQLLDESTPAIDGEFTLNGRRYPIMRTQAIPHEYKWDDPGMMVELYSVCLMDLGHAQWDDKASPTRIISSYALRSPEVILGAKWDTKVDIWSIGCMTFELLTGHWLFHPQRGSTWRKEDDHLAKMMEHTGDRFNESFLAQCQNRDEYFDQNGNLLRIEKLLPVPLEQAMANYGLPEAEVLPAASFIRACLRLDPNERATARDLELHAWLESAFVCC